MKNEKCGKGQTMTIKIFTFNFLYRKIYILFKNIASKYLVLQLHLHYSFFFVNCRKHFKLRNSNAHKDLHWSCKRRASTRNT